MDLSACLTRASRPADLEQPRADWRLAGWDEIDIKNPSSRRTGELKIFPSHLALELSFGSRRRLGVVYQIRWACHNELLAVSSGLLCVIEGVTK